MDFSSSTDEVSCNSSVESSSGLDSSPEEEAMQLSCTFSFLCEPIDSSSGSSSSSTDSDSEVVSPRLLNLNWYTNA